MTQVIKKRRIVLASVLKPVDDTRMLEKIGASLASSGQFEVTIIGYPSFASEIDAALIIKPLPSFKRFSFNRLTAPWKVSGIIHDVDPEIVIINTPELLWVALYHRLFFKRKIIYDILENYYRTILHTNAYPLWLRLPLAMYVRLTEKISRCWVSHYFFAEKGYAKELSFAHPNTILENKLPTTLAKKFKRNHQGYSRLIFTGTLAPTTGVMEAINLVRALHEVDSSFTLTIVGYCALPEFLRQLKTTIAGTTFIKLLGGDRHVPHNQILEHLSQADYGIVIYSLNPSTESSIPTKLYEYLSIHLPVLIRHNRESHQLVQQLNGGLILDPQPDVYELARQLKAASFTLVDEQPPVWDSENEKLMAYLNSF